MGIWKATLNSTSDPVGKTTDLLFLDNGLLESSPTVTSSFSNLDDSTLAKDSQFRTKKQIDKSSSKKNVFGDILI